MKQKKTLAKPSKAQVKSLVLFSGGLDSRLVIKLLQEQGIEVHAIYFKIPFGGSCCNNFDCIFNYSQTQGIKLHVIDCTKPPLFQEYLEMIKKPKFGRGSSFNTCKDCRIFMLKKAKEFAEKNDFQIIATGEVLDQRPMSQNKKALFLIEKEAGLENNVLRPLSAKKLPETIAEKNNLVDRSKLLNLQGRQRKIQMQLAKKYKIKYPDSGGGCLLCEKNYKPKIKDLLNNRLINTIKPEEIQLLNIGRHFKSKETRGKLVVGRNEKENNILEELNKTLNYSILAPEQDIPGPTVLFENPDDRILAQHLIDAYSKKDNPEQRKHFDEIRLK